MAADFELPTRALSAVTLALLLAACLGPGTRGTVSQDGANQLADGGGWLGADGVVPVDWGSDPWVTLPDPGPAGPDALQPDIGGICIPEGAGFEASDTVDACCPGLVAVPACVQAASGGCACPECACYVCTACGDGQCGPGENTCNCEADCGATLNICAVLGGECVPADPGSPTDGCPSGTGEVELAGCGAGGVCCMAGQSPCVYLGKKPSGVPGEPECCPGLVLTPVAAYDTDGTCDPSTHNAICTLCGDGVCDTTHERYCTCEEDCGSCVPEGSQVTSESPPQGCCEGLQPIPVAWYNDNTGECLTAPGTICAACGNGVCEFERPETGCSCPQDCSGDDLCALAGGSCAPKGPGGGCTNGTGTAWYAGCAPDETCCVPMTYCRKAGQFTSPLGSSPDCCAGLDAIPVTVSDASGDACAFQQGAVVCSDCGNGSCESWEDACSCPGDCPAGSCGAESEIVGATISEPECCAGLAAIDVSSFDRTQGLCSTIFEIALCSDCGDGHCQGLWENPCNCLEDCDEALRCADHGGSCEVPVPNPDGDGCPAGSSDVWYGGCAPSEVCCLPD